MQVDAAGKEQEPGRVDLALGARDAADARDAPVFDADIRPLAPGGRDDGPAADG
ncbi:MAG TPA: hypothetical protein VFC31_03845 [Candidatus Limnocylindria bacterium]|nr:hypothetical protein [Candidatus Limnocylindria bacterium]